jgi:hypothetical protein
MTSKRNLLRAASTRSSQPAALPSPDPEAAARFVAGDSQQPKKRERYSVFLEPQIKDRLWRYNTRRNLELPEDERKSLSDLVEQAVVEFLDRMGQHER